MDFRKNAKMCLFVKKNATFAIGSGGSGAVARRVLLDVK